MIYDETTATVVLEIDEMAKAKKAAAPVPVPDDVPRTLFSIKGRMAWHDWLKEYAESRGMQATTVIDFALSEQAKRDGFARPMPRRMGSK